MARKRENHGMSNHPAYKAWKRMVARCVNPNSSHFEYYGGRGIKVAPEWLSFVAFWIDMGDSWKPGLSLDRINSNGNYEKNNCRWADLLTQMRNRRSSLAVVVDGKAMAASEAAQSGTVKYATFLHRVNKGQNVTDALNTPPATNPKPRRVEIDGTIYPSLSAAGKALGVTRSAIFNRLKHGSARYVQ